MWEYGGFEPLAAAGFRLEWEALMAFVRHHKELRVYQLAFEAAMLVFELSKKWPVEERYSLTDQIRRSSRSVCGNIAEAWRKRRYPNHFVSKLSDADGEVAETQNWLDFAQACGYINPSEHQRIWNSYDQVARGLVAMMANSDAWCGPAMLVREERAEYVAIEVEQPI